VIKAIHTRLDQREEGFTLIELLVVVIIIGILAAVAIPVFLNQRNRAYRAAVQSDLRNMAVEAETYFTDNQSYERLEASTFFTNFRESTGVTLTIQDADTTANSYCITGTHSSNPTEVWNIRPGNDLGQVGVNSRTACSAPATTTP